MPIRTTRTESPRPPTLDPVARRVLRGRARAIRRTVLALALCAVADRAVAARWVVNENGNCVKVWSASSIGRGPLAMLNALTMPPRQLVGGGRVGYEEPLRSASERVLRVPVLSLLGLGAGVVESVVVLGGGLLDFLTGGYFDFVPEEVATLSVRPMTPRFLERPPPPRPVDPCGRPA